MTTRLVLGQLEAESCHTFLSLFQLRADRVQLKTLVGSASASLRLLLIVRFSEEVFSSWAGVSSSCFSVAGEVTDL